MEHAFSQDFRFETRRILRGLARDILKQSSAIFDPNDIEPLHQMRVAVNKLRVGLEHFGDATGRKRRAELLGELRWFKDCLGQVRDHDVMLERLRGIAHEASEVERTGADLAQEMLQEERAAALANLGAETARKRYRRLKERLADFAKAMKKPVAPRHPQDLREGVRLDVRAARILGGLFRTFEKRRRRLIESFSPEAMHVLRITGKKLRYNLAFFMAQRPELYEPLYKTLDELHECVGAMHDIDVLAPKIEASFARRYLAQPREAALRAEAGVRWVLDRLHEQRQELMRQFHGLWETVSSEGFADRVHTACQPPVASIALVASEPSPAAVHAAS
ncbi:MAG: CHAD domain-containing protein [Candidatus Sumerlaeota bacterium]|nr:CHAD domain-containing protein [Candidatus Sumerlaeota bacterium]